MAPVVGRDRELAVADDFLALAGERSRALVFEGEAGIGKTTIWREATRRAGKGGFRVLACRPAELEAKLAFSAVADLLEDIPPEAVASLPRPQRRALEVALLRVEPGTQPPEPRLIASAFRSLLEVLNDEGPLLVAVDDVQWLDAESAMVIQFALRRLTAAPMGWLFSRRLDEPARLLPERLVAHEALTRVTVGPLTLAALHHVLTDQLDEPLIRPVLARVHTACAGNPLYALEVARELLQHGDAASLGTVPVPPDLGKLISRRVRQLPEPTRDALLACAALSEPTTSLVEEQSLVPAEEGDIVSVDGEGHIAFRHPLYASAVYGSSSRARRRELHASLADVVDDPEERARHLALAAASPDERIAQALEEGAALARSRGAWEAAGELLERAASLTPPARPDDAHRRAIAAAEHHVHAGDRPRARRLTEATLAADPRRPLRATALRVLGEIAVDDEHLMEARRVFGEALEHVDEPGLAAEIEANLAYVADSMCDFLGAVPHSHRALELAEAAGDRRLIGEALAHCAVVDWVAGNGADWDKIERSLALEEPEAVVALRRRPSTLAACLMAYVGRHSEARERLSAVCATARERGDESDLGFVLLWFSWLETRCGDFDRAVELAEEAVSVATLTGSRSMHGWALTQRAYVSAHLGAVEETRRDCAEAEALVEGSGYVLPWIWIAASLALLELSLGNAEAAWRACEPLVQGLEAQGIAEPVTAFFLPDALEALISLGELDRAEALLAVFERRGRELDGAWALAAAGRCRGVLHAARGEHDAAIAALDRSLHEHERIELPFERARALLAKGAAERRARRRSRAKDTLEQALAEFERLGAPLFAERARGELSRVGLRQSDGDHLTPSERRIAELAGSGLTNREIAAELFVSPKTVEASLGRAYRKLGIRSRAQLATHLTEHEQLQT